MKSLCLALLVVFLACRSLETRFAKDAPRPNVILVMTDDQGFGDVGFRDHEQLITPTLDELARTAIRFDRFYAAAPVCSPTRASCLTGRHPDRLAIGGANDGHMPPAEITLAERLLKEGYRTGHFGKWHLGTLTTEVEDSNRGGPRGKADFAPPWQHGFERCFSTEAKVPTYDPMRTPPAWAGGVGKKEVGTPYGTAYWDESGKRVTDGLEGDDSRIIMDRAIRFIETAADRDDAFLAVIWLHAPHLPVLAGREHLDRYESIANRKKRHYYACITALDEQLGRLRSTLRQLGVEDNTLLWFCSDNGPESSSDDAPGRTMGLRGRKRSLFEGGIRVPAFLEWPGRFARPRTIEAPCVTSDFLPTILTALELPLPDRPLDGIDLTPLLDGEVELRSQAIGFHSKKQEVWMENRYKLIRRQGEVSLFDIQNDASETEDLALSSPELVQRMSAELDAWLNSCAESAAGGDY